MNVSFFGTGESKFVSKLSGTADKSPMPRGSEIARKPTFDFASERRNTAIEVKRPEDEKKMQKNKIMKTFKEEVERLLDF